MSSFGAARVYLSHDAVHIFLYMLVQEFVELRLRVWWRLLGCSLRLGCRGVLLPNFDFC